MERPLIGVTTSEVRLAENVELTPQADPPRREMALGLTYLRAIEAAGGLPVVMPPLGLDAVSPLLDRLAGVCLSGGPDLDPESYSEPPHPKLGPTEPDLDRFELAAARAADARGLPLLAICRGAQALNVARGGSLHQHIPRHRQKEPGETATHMVDVAPRSRLATVLGGRQWQVNSFHHQAVFRLGRGLRAVAWSPDGVVEGVEGTGARFVLGVQWHAECLVDRDEQAALFAAFVSASAAFAKTGREIMAA